MINIRSYHPILPENAKPKGQAHEHFMPLLEELDHLHIFNGCHQVLPNFLKLLPRLSFESRSQL